MSRGKSRDCMCTPAPSIENCRKGRCKYGYCLEWKCPACRKVAYGFGPLLCKCDVPRSFIYPGMREKKHPPVKESHMRKHQRHRPRKR